MKVTSPDGQTWRISRRWVPWRRRLTGTVQRMPRFHLSSFGDDGVSALIWLLLVIVAIPFFLLMVLAGVELLLALVLIPVAAGVRALLGAPWTVEVRRGWSLWTEEKAGDWQASDLRIHELADEIRAGSVPEQTLNLKKAKQGQRAEQGV